MQAYPPDDDAVDILMVEAKFRECALELNTYVDPDHHWTRPAPNYRFPFRFYTMNELHVILGRIREELCRHPPPDP